MWEMLNKHDSVTILFPNLLHRFVERLGFFKFSASLPQRTIRTAPSAYCPRTWNSRNSTLRELSTTNLTRFSFVPPLAFRIYFFFHRLQTPGLALLAPLSGSIVQMASYLNRSERHFSSPRVPSTGSGKNAESESGLLNGWSLIRTLPVSKNWALISTPLDLLAKALRSIPEERIWSTAQRQVEISGGHEIISQTLYHPEPSDVRNQGVSASLIPESFAANVVKARLARQARGKSTAVEDDADDPLDNITTTRIALARSRKE
ncbi:hypothetical protein R3P38DRAFT_3344804 [Favolaschia claudopus]|uniref:Uncharacterized protein n=1 Tax=Favolaschia claudopus TaxID=2862362 RepID=A0AAW0DHE2_9AGAR